MKPASQKLKHSFASYRKGKEIHTNPKSIARALLSWGDIPKYLNDLRAAEIALLASDYLRLVKKLRKLK